MKTRLDILATPPQYHGKSDMDLFSIAFAQSQPATENFNAGNAMIPPLLDFDEKAR